MPQQILLLLLSLSLCCYNTTPLTDTISLTRPLKDGQILTSQGTQSFALGFFSPQNSTRHRYLGIWYNKVATQTVVWVANRDRPINGSDGTLSIADDSNLLLSSNNTTIRLTNISSKQTDPKLQLLDSGNLVLMFGTEHVILWQSFDYPTHVFLPGMKLGLDRRTGFERYLTSWRSTDDPGHGSYTFRVNPEIGGSDEFFLYKDGSVRVWRTGPWVGDRWSGVPEMSRGYIFNYRFVDTADEVYATYNVSNPSIVSMFFLDTESGTVQRTTWHETSRQWNKFWEVPQEDCDKYAHCGGFGLCNPSTDQFECSCLAGYKPKSARDWYLRDGSEGCVRDGNVSMCGNGEGFLTLPNVKVPDTTSARTNMSMSLLECREECLRNCSCSAFTSATDGGGAGGSPTGCILFHGDLVDIRSYDTGGGQDLHVRVDAVELAKSLGKAKGNYLSKEQLVILLVCILLLISFITFLAYWFHRKNRRGWKEREERCLWLEELEESNSKSSSPVFRVSTISAATSKFDPTNLLGEGGFGPVYKGKLSSGLEIAVKRLSKHSGQGINEFKNEVRLISKLQHRNLVKTLGCCVSGEDKMLVYEFLPNGSLDQYIFEEKRTLLDWSKRYEIIIGIARGVLYLHQDSRLKIIHRDLKASNVLLDAEMIPKISDFGMARIFGTEQSEANTNRVVGTYGYMSPEYAMEGLFSIKSDVFSFGIIVLEIIGGKRSSGYYNDFLCTNLSGYAWKLWEDGNAMDLVDESIRSSVGGNKEEVLRCIHIGLLCAQEDPNDRPTMQEVTFMLSNNSELPSPKEPAFILRGNRYNSGDPLMSSSTEADHSVNEVTVSMVDGR